VDAGLPKSKGPGDRAVQLEQSLPWSQCPSWPLFSLDSNKCSNKKQDESKFLIVRILQTNTIALLRRWLWVRAPPNPKISIRTRKSAEPLWKPFGGRKLTIQCAIPCRCLLLFVALFLGRFGRFDLSDRCSVYFSVLHYPFGQFRDEQTLGKRRFAAVTLLQCAGLRAIEREE
jgi:hypothetical protein